MEGRSPLAAFLGIFVSIAFLGFLAGFIIEIGRGFDDGNWRAGPAAGEAYAKTSKALTSMEGAMFFHSNREDSGVKIVIGFVDVLNNLIAAPAGAGGVVGDGVGALFRQIAGRQAPVVPMPANSDGGQAALAPAPETTSQQRRSSTTENAAATDDADPHLSPKSVSLADDAARAQVVEESDDLIGGTADPDVVKVGETYHLRMGVILRTDASRTSTGSYVGPGQAVEILRQDVPPDGLKWVAVRIENHTGFIQGETLKYMVKQ